MTIELTQEELALVDMLLSKEESDTRVEIHHCRDHAYRSHLKERERTVSELLGRLRSAAVAR